MENSWRAEEEEADSRGFIRLGTLHVLNRAGIPICRKVLKIMFWEVTWLIG